MFIGKTLRLQIVAGNSKVACVLKI